MIKRDRRLGLRYMRTENSNGKRLWKRMGNRQMRENSKKIIAECR